VGRESTGPQKKEGYSLKKERTDYVKKEEGKERQERSL
jgi:hypothetical protein